MLYNLQKGTHAGVPSGQNHAPWDRCGCWPAWGGRHWHSGGMYVVGGLTRAVDPHTGAGVPPLGAAKRVLAGEAYDDL